jgi:hypothetical protein
MDFLSKQEVRGNRNKNGKSGHKFQSSYFDDEKQNTRKAAGHRGHSRHIEGDVHTIDFDDDFEYADLIDPRLIK